MTRNPYPRGGRMGGLGGFNLGGPAPPDLLAILGVLFVTFALSFFQSTAILPERQS